MAEPFKPRSVAGDDEDLYYHIGELVAFSQRMTSVGYYPNDDMAMICQLCNDVDGHLEGCPIATLAEVERLTVEELNARKAKKAETDRRRT